MQFAPFYPLLHPILKTTFPDCLWMGCAQQKTIALTFDDGPHPQHTLQVLAVLDRYQVKASFFWLGMMVDRYPDVARAVHQQAHWLALHGYEHRLFPSLTAVELQQSLQQTQRAIAQACHFDLAAAQHRIRDVRPPVGVVTPKTVKLLQQWHYRPVMWSVVPEDWVRPGVEVAAARVMTQAQNGSLIVLHDGYYGGEDAAATADRIIPALLKQGYRFVSIEAFWQQRSTLPTPKFPGSLNF